MRNRLNTILILLFASWFQQSAQAAPICAEVLEGTKAVSVGKKATRTKIRLNASERVVFLGFNKKNKKYAKIQLGNTKYWTLSRKLGSASGDVCFPQTCFQLTDDYAVFETAERYTESYPEPGLYPVLSVTEVFGENWYRFQSGENEFWAPAETFAEAEEGCPQDPAEKPAETKPLKVPSDPDKEATKPSDETELKKSERGTWKYGVEAGYGVVSSNPIAGSVTAIPGATEDVNDDNFSSPFIESVEGGMGFYLGAFVEIPFTEKIAGRFTLGYGEREMSQTLRPNPHRDSPSFIVYSELDTVVEPISYRSIYLSAFPSYKLNFLSIPWRLGLNLRFQYYLDQKVNEFRTGPQKLVAYFEASGYEEYEFEVAPRVEAHFLTWAFAYIELNNRIYPEVDFVMEPYFGVGAQF